MKPKKGAHSWPSTSHSTMWQDIGATTWLFRYLQNPALANSCNDAWQTTLVSAGDLLANRSHAQVFLVLASSAYTFAAWEMEVEKDETETMFKPYAHFALGFHHILDAEQWVSVPYAPALAGPHGPLVLKQTGPSMHPMYGRIEKGLSLSVEQCKQFLKMYEVPFKGNASSKALHQLLFNRFLDSDEEVQQAMQRMNLASVEVASEPPSDDEYEDLLEVLDANEMQGDPDLKNEKQKLKGKKRKKAYHKALDAKAAADAKGKAKKAKAKAKAMSKKKIGLKGAKMVGKKRKGATPTSAEAAKPAEVGFVLFLAFVFSIFF